MDEVVYRLRHVHVEYVEIGGASSTKTRITDLRTGCHGGVSGSAAQRNDTDSAEFE